LEPAQNLVTCLWEMLQGAKKWEIMNDLLSIL
jgi:hypothetical protein